MIRGLIFLLAGGMLFAILGYSMVAPDISFPTELRPCP